MSQQNLSQTAANFAAPADLFAKLTVGGTTANLSNVIVGEKVTAAGGGTAKVSGLGVTANTLRLKAVKGAAGTWTGALTFNKSAAAAMTASAFAYTSELKRIDAADGTVEVVTEYTYELTDKGFVVDTASRLNSKANAPKKVVSAIRAGVSKSQNTDQSNAPTLTATGFTVIAGKTSRAATQSISKAAKGIIRILVTSNESLNVTVGGTALKYTLTFAAGGGTVTAAAVYNSQASSATRLVFEYTMTGLENNGVMVSAVYAAGTSTITDIGDVGNTARTPGNVTVTGWTVAA